MYRYIYMCVFNKITMYISKISYRYNYVCRPPIPLMEGVIVLLLVLLTLLFMFVLPPVFETSDEHRAGRAFLL